MFRLLSVMIVHKCFAQLNSYMFYLAEPSGSAFRFNDEKGFLSSGKTIHLKNSTCSCKILSNVYVENKKPRLYNVPMRR